MDVETIIFKGIIMHKNNQQLDMLIQALKGAAIGIAAAIDDETITSQQAYSLLLSLINQLETSLIDPDKCRNLLVETRS
tara:strand:+ start:103534 stop:103770 length:237 start_codon:yes stop_codon:yes gene_type:complete